MPAILRRPAFQKPPAGSQIDLSHPHAQGLISSWDMLEEGSFVIRDNVPGSNGETDGVVSDTILWRPGGAMGTVGTQGVIPAHGTSLTSIGVNTKFISVANNTRYNKTKFSMEVWIRTPEGMNTTPHQWIFGRDTSATRHGACFIFGAGNIVSWLIAGQQGVNTAATSFVPNDGKWHHLIGNVSFDATPTKTCQFYADGKFVGSTTITVATDWAGATVTRWMFGLDAFWPVAPAGVQYGPTRWRDATKDGVGWITPDMAQWLYEEPYAMFRAPEVDRRFWFFRSAVIASRRRQNVAG